MIGDAVEFERVDADELFAGWVVVLGNMPHEFGRRRYEVARVEGETTLVELGGGLPLPLPLSIVEEMPIYRVHAALPSALGYYSTEDPDHELIERTSTGWRSTDVDGTPLAPAEVREMGELAHYVRESQLAFAEKQARNFRDAAVTSATELATVLAELAEARAEVAPSHAAGRAEALGEVWSFLRARGLWWRPVRRALARRFGRALTGA